MTIPHLKAKTTARAALAYHAVGRLAAQNMNQGQGNRYYRPAAQGRISDYSIRCAIGAALTIGQAQKADTALGYSITSLVQAGHFICEQPDLEQLEELQQLHDRWAGGQTPAGGSITGQQLADREQAFLAHARQLAQITTLNAAKLARAALTAHGTKTLCANNELARSNREARGEAAAYYVDIMYPYNGIGCAIGVGLDHDDRIMAENRPAGLPYNIGELIEKGLFNVSSDEDREAIRRLQYLHDNWSSELANNSTTAGVAERAFLVHATSMIPVFEAEPSAPTQ